MGSQQRYTVGKQIDLPAPAIGLNATEHYCQNANGWAHGSWEACGHCYKTHGLAGAPMLDAATAAEIDEACDPLCERRNVFVGRRRVDHVWIIIALVLSLVLAMKAPDWPDIPAPTPAHCTPIGVR